MKFRWISLSQPGDGEAIQAVEKVMLLNSYWQLILPPYQLCPKICDQKNDLAGCGLVNYVNNAYQEMLAREYKGKIWNRCWAEYAGRWNHETTGSLLLVERQS